MKYHYERDARAHGFAPQVFLDLIEVEHAEGYVGAEAYDRALVRLTRLDRCARLIVNIVVAALVGVAALIAWRWWPWGLPSLAVIVVGSARYLFWRQRCYVESPAWGSAFGGGIPRAIDDGGQSMKAWARVRGETATHVGAAASWHGASPASDE